MRSVNTSRALPCGPSAEEKTIFHVPPGVRASSAGEILQAIIPIVKKAVLKKAFIILLFIVSVNIVSVN
jgi:hypothetical protein